MEADAYIIGLTMPAVFLPLVSCLVIYVIPDRFNISSKVASGFSSITLLSAIGIFAITWHATPHNLQWPWFSIDRYTSSIHILIDNQASIMLLLVATISCLVHFFSIGYMSHEPRQQKYFAMLGFFTFSMIGIVLAGNLLMLFFFWELVGFSSFRLIGLHEEKIKAVKASTKALLMTRIGDVVFFAGLMMLWNATGSLDIDSIGNIAMHTSPQHQTIICICIFCGVIGKSAQFPLLSWLPDAMEGPTPVSALIHAATMVAAGIYLLARLYFIFTPNALLVVAVVGALTAIAGGINAVFRFDIKKILAYSTVSQLGLMVMTMGAGNPDDAFQHLMTHGIFKAGLFLSAGALIHIIHQHQREHHLHFDAQDIRQTGGFSKTQPFIFAMMVICACSLIGLPLTAGFISKDAMLSGVYPNIFLVIGFIVSIITVVYTFRLMWYLFHGRTPAVDITQNFATLPWAMRVPLFILALGSLCWILSINPFATQTWLHSGLSAELQETRDLRVISALIVIITLLLSWQYFKRKEIRGTEEHLLSLDSVYHKIIVAPLLKFSTFTTVIDRGIDVVIYNVAVTPVILAHIVTWIDKNIVDGVVTTITRIAAAIGALTRSPVNGKIQSYLLWLSVALIIFIACKLIW